MEAPPDAPPKKRRWRWWTIVVLNLAGALLILPLFKVVLPLVSIWWSTRSQDSLRAHERSRSQAPATVAQAPAEPEASLSASPSSDTNAAFQKLTNQLGLLEQLSDKDLGKIISHNFGAPGRTSAPSAQFDLDSAVFDSISKTTVVYQGKSYLGYRVDLVDRSGNHQTNIDCFAEPNLDYERSLATLELMSRSPQLKRIYQAMAASLAEKAGQSGDASTDSSTNGPVFRIESAPAQGHP